VAHEINTPIQFIGDNLRFIADSLASINVLLDSYRQALSDAPGLGPDGRAELAAQRDALVQLEKDIDLDFLREEMVLAARQAIDGTERVATIVHAMKAFAHPGGKEKTLVDLNQVIRDTLVVANSQVKLVADVVLDFAELPPVWCNVGDINQAVLNLIINAAQAMGEAAAAGRGRGTLTVVTRRLQDTVEIEIQDTGNGIPDEIAERVFEQFFTTKAVGVGTGQGLALAYTLIHDRHEGTIGFTSRPGAGTTFTIQLPRRLS
ncbi:MAG TPA: ATP-binding protein, partial [Dermatophilaceae bacterium]